MDNKLKFHLDDLQLNLNCDFCDLYDSERRVGRVRGSLKSVKHLVYQNAVGVKFE
jgi:hypothetical protein